MAEYTKFFRDYISDVGGEILETNEGIQLNRADLVGLGHYPVYDPRLRLRVNALIVGHFMMREIGAETDDIFRNMLSSRMREVMPTYSRLYQADEIQYNPLLSIDVHTLSSGELTQKVTGTATSNTSDLNTGTQEVETEGTGKSVNIADSKSRAVASETPQAMLAKGGEYASSAADNIGKTQTDGESNENTSAKTELENRSTSDGKSDTASDSEGTSRDESRVQGYQGAPAALLSQYRESLWQTDVLLLKELDICFMQIRGASAVRPNRFGNSAGLVYPRF